MNLVERVKGILLTPKKEWAVIDGESATVGSLYTQYIMPLAAIPAVAGFIGVSIIGIGVLGSSIRVPPGTGLTAMVVRYVGALVGVYVLALVIDALAPNFGGQKSPIQALKVAAYSSTAAWVAGIFLLLPGLRVLGLLGLYSLYLLYLGLPVLMKAPEDRAAGYTIVVIVVAVVLYMVVGAIANRMLGYGWMY
jgi:Yip1 domain